MKRLSVCFGAAILTASSVLSAAGFPPAATTQPLLMMHGETNAPSAGDYISSTVGLNTYYSYFIEVVPGLSSMQVEIYDPDIRQGPDAEEQVTTAIRDQTRSTGMVMTYTLLNPTGGTVATQTGSATLPTASHATWWTFATPTSPAAGHWELRANAGAGSNVAGYGVRARGFNGATQVDLNVYVHSYMSYQLHAAAFRTYTTYPFVTGYCQLRVRDFDNDDGAPANTSSMQISSALPSAASQTFTTLAANDSWATNDTTRATFFSDASVQRPGIWTSTLSVSGPGGNTNEGQFYFANTNDISGATAPSAQPQSNSWRIYLPMLDASVPVKPTVYQNLFYVSGPNPMVVGSQTILRVTVGVANRTSRPIVFSAANLVSAFVPGGAVLYGGTPSVSTGAIVAQPAVGGSGAITWNPGTVPAGGVVDLTYLIRVTPAASGRVIVTGTPAANGTSARYIDETGNTTQARATYTWGPLCELAATTGAGNAVPTPATIAKVSATRRGSGVVDIEWTTGVEVGVAGWSVLSSADSEALPLPNGEIAAAGDRLDGQRYRLPGVGLAGESFYLRSRDIDGRSQLHGPYRVDRSVGVIEHPIEIPWAQIAADSQSLQSARIASLPLGKRNRVQIRVRERGIQSVSFQSLSALNTTLAGAAVDQIAVLRDGQAWPRRVRSADALFGQGDRVEFVAEAEPGFVVEYRVYELVVDPAKALNIEPQRPMRGPVQPLNTVTRRTQIADQNGYAFSSPLPDPFYMTRFSSALGQPVSQRFSLSTPYRIASAPATLNVSLWGGLDYPEIADEHGYRIVLNENVIDENHFNGLEAQTLELSASASVLSGDVQQLDVWMLADRAPFDVLNIESVAIDYPAAPQIEGGALDFVAMATLGDGPALPQAELIFGNEFDLGPSSFDCGAVDEQSLCWSLQTQGLSADASAYRVDPDGRTREISIVDGLIRDIKVPDARLWLANTSAMPQPELVLQTADPAVPEGADYLVITHPNFALGLGILLQLRQSQGLTTQVVTTESIYASGGGQPSAAAISGFIAASAALGTRYVLLVGGDSYDSAGYLYTGSIGFVPSPYTRLHEVVLFGAADSLYADVDGDQKPDLAIGRFPVRTSAELQTLIDKTLALEGKVSGRALFLSDDADVSGYSFDTAQRSLGSLLGPTWQTRHESLDTSSASALGTIAQQELQNGLGLLQYLGHSSPIAWSSPAPGILPPSTIFAGALADALHPTLLIQWGCWNSYHVLPSYNTMAHAWLLGPGAAGAVIGSAAITETEHDYRLSERLLGALNHHQRLGDALKAAKRDLATGDPSLVDVLLGTTLLGDPALVLRTAQ